MSSHRQPIGPNDIVSVQGRYLVRQQPNNNNNNNNNNSFTERFLMQGMAFPIAPRSITTTNDDADGYDEQGWIAVLEQLAADTTAMNTVRLYQLNCTVAIPKYDAFFQRAAELGFYVIIPLTTVTGDGVLNRNHAAPLCYNRTLYQYGTTCMDLMARHANILAGMIGNEVMNALKTWPAAPCIKAYARDLKSYAATAATTTTTTLAAHERRTSFPLVYAAQHDSPTAAVLPDTTMKLTMEYLTCQEDEDEEDDDNGNGKDKDDLWIDMFGINVESWCSSLQTFAFNEDGVTESAYHALYQTMRNASSVPLVFTEMGCSKQLFNRDNGLERYTRDWKQVPVVLQDMVDVFSGFCAYAYDGNPLFRIMGSDGDIIDGTQEAANSSSSSSTGAHWNGHDVLKPTQEYSNLAQQLQAYADKGIVLTVPTTGSTNTPLRRSCAQVRQEILQVWNVPLLPLHRMPEYSRKNDFPWTMVIGVAAFVALLLGLAARKQQAVAQQGTASTNGGTNDKAGPTESDPLLSATSSSSSSSSTA